MVTILVYILLFIFWTELTFKFSVSAIKGLSLFNLSLFALLLGWVVAVAFRRNLLVWCDLYKYLFFLMCVMVASIPLKYIAGEFEQTNLIQEVISLKNWAEPFILFVLVFNLIGNRATAKNLVVGLVALMLLSVFVTLSVVLDLFPVGEIQRERGGNWPVFAEPNQYGAYIVLMIPFLIAFFNNSRRILVKGIIGLATLIAILGLISTGSRGSFLGFLTSLGVFFLVASRAKMIRRSSVIISTILIFSIAAISFSLIRNNLLERTLDRVSAEKAENLDDYSSGRLTIWATALRYYAKRPLFGYGLNGFHSIVQENLLPYGNSHNNYLRYLVDHGLIGLLAFLMLLARILRTNLNALATTHDSYAKNLYLGFLCGFVGFCVAMFFVVVLDLWNLVLLYVAVVYRYIQLELGTKRTAQTGHLHTTGIPHVSHRPLERHTLA